MDKLYHKEKPKSVFKIMQNIQIKYHLLEDLVFTLTIEVYSCKLSLSSFLCHIFFLNFSLGVLMNKKLQIEVLHFRNTSIVNALQKTML